MKKILIAMGLLLAFSQGALADDGKNVANADVTPMAAATQTLDSVDIVAAFGEPLSQTEEMQIALLSNEEMALTVGAKAKVKATVKAAAQKAAAFIKERAAVSYLLNFGMSHSIIKLGTVDKMTGGKIKSNTMNVLDKAVFNRAEHIYQQTGVRLNR